MSSGVEFEEDKMGYAVKRQQFSNSQPTFVGGVGINNSDPKMIQWLMRKGIVKSSGAGQVVLIVILLLNVIITYFIIKFLL